MNDVTLTMALSPMDARAVLAFLDERSVDVDEARETARTLHDAKTGGTPEVNEETADYNPDDRIYGEKGAKARRTKDEMAEDKMIAERWATLWPSKEVPAKPIGELLAALDKVEMREAEEGFDVGDEPTTEPMDLDEFRGVLNKAVKAIGGKAMLEIMTPYKSGTEVPEDERRAYATKIEEAL